MEFIFVNISLKNISLKSLFWCYSKMIGFGNSARNWAGVWKSHVVFSSPSIWFPQAQLGNNAHRRHGLTIWLCKSYFEPFIIYRHKINTLVFVCFLFFCFVLDRVLCNPGWSWVHCVNEAILELLTLLPLPLKGWDYSHTASCPAKFISFKIYNLRTQYVYRVVHPSSIISLKHSLTPQTNPVLIWSHCSSMPSIHTFRLSELTAEILAKPLGWYSLSPLYIYAYIHKHVCTNLYIPILFLCVYTFVYKCTCMKGCIKRMIQIAHMETR